MPVTVELLALRLRERATWILVAVLAVALFYFGWHHGAAVVALPGKDLARAGESFQLGLLLFALWVLVMPFMQARLEVRAWTANYHYLFAYAWRNAVALFEAAVFTGVFWLLLELWQSLFTMLGMGFFRELFAEPVFVYPVTALVFGCALHLIGSIDRFVSAVLEQILNVFKWLGTLTGALLALFTLALMLQLPHLVFTGHRAISAVWLLWLAAVVVLFLNAAYRDGVQARPYPGWIAFALRLVVPLSVVITLTALYALRVRAQRYGLTVERVFGFIVAAAALCYSVGYSLAALSRRAWFGGVARVNVLVALGLILVLGLVLTPVLSPYRLAAASQYQRILDGKPEEESHAVQGQSAFQYLGLMRARTAGAAWSSSHGCRTTRTPRASASARPRRCGRPTPGNPSPRALRRSWSRGCGSIRRAPHWRPVSPNACAPTWIRPAPTTTAWSPRARS